MASSLAEKLSVQTENTKMQPTDSNDAGGGEQELVSPVNYLELLSAGAKHLLAARAKHLLAAGALDEALFSWLENAEVPTVDPDDVGGEEGPLKDLASQGLEHVDLPQPGSRQDGVGRGDLPRHPPWTRSRSSPPFS